MFHDLSPDAFRERPPVVPHAVHHRLGRQFSRKTPDARIAQAADQRLVGVVVDVVEGRHVGNQLADEPLNVLVRQLGDVRLPLHVAHATVRHEVIDESIIPQGVVHLFGIKLKGVDPHRGRARRDGDARNGDQRILDDAKRGRHGGGNIRIITAVAGRPPYHFRNALLHIRVRQVHALR